MYIFSLIMKMCNINYTVKLDSTFSVTTDNYQVIKKNKKKNGYYLNINTNREGFGMLMIVKQSVRYFVEN
jgi:hypothetical protein